MKKTSGLTGALLDFWVARAEGSTDAMVAEWSSGTICLSSHHAFEDVPFRPSTNWGDGGLLIEKYNLDLFSGTNPPEPFSWKADNGAGVFESGSTPLEAICRAVVRSVFGDEVGEVPC